MLIFILSFRQGQRTTGLHNPGAVVGEKFMQLSCHKGCAEVAAPRQICDDWRANF
jgi:hypothetical protein